MKNRKYGTRWITLMALFVAIQLFLNLTGIGLIPLPVIKGTTLHIPVIIGAVILGPMAGGILGGVFGLCSIWNNTMTPSLLSFAFSPFFALSNGYGPKVAVISLWIVLGCRILIGVVAGWLWIGLKRVSIPFRGRRLRIHDFVALPIVGAAGALTNTGLVMGSIFLLLAPEFAAAKNIALDAVLGAVMVTVTTSGVSELLAAVILVTAIGKALLTVLPASARRVSRGTGAVCPTKETEFR